MQRFDDLRDALTASVTGKRQLVITGAGTVAAFVVVTLLSFPAYTQQLLGASMFYLDDAVVALTWNMHQSAGTTGLLLAIIYAGLVGATLSVLSLQIQLNGVRAAGNVGGVVPGMLASGCAGCGVGLLSLMGFAGVVSALPFHGNSIRVAGILVLVYVLARVGDPRRCTVDL